MVTQTLDIEPPTYLEHFFLLLKPWARSNHVCQYVANQNKQCTSVLQSKTSTLHFDFCSNLVFHFHSTSLYNQIWWKCLLYE